MRSHEVTVLNQMQQVFVYEIPEENFNRQSLGTIEENGTFNLLKSLPEGSIATAKDLNAIRREFIQRVFTYYIVKLGAGVDEE